MLEQVPYCSFYAHLACHLRDGWFELDRIIEIAQACESDNMDKTVENLLKKAADINDTILFVADLFAVMHDRGAHRLSSMLTNALLNYAYLPILV